MVRPNFILLGAPKCGTSSLYNWLTLHPDIVGSRRKETFILMDRDNPLLGHPNIHDDGMSAFDNEFGPEAAQATIRMEATTHTLFQTTALAQAAEWPDLKVAVVMREPAARVQSSFAYTQNNLGRISPDIGLADYCTAVAQGDPLTNMVQHEASAYVLARDIEYSRYARWLAPWIETLGKDRVLPILFEDMRADPQTTLRQVTDWLELPPVDIPREALEARNRTEAVRSPKVQRVMRHLNSLVPVPRGLKALLKSAYMAVQGKPAITSTRTSRDMHALEKLRADYAADNASLAQLTGLDLSVWVPAQAATGSQNEQPGSETTTEKHA